MPGKKVDIISGFLGAGKTTFIQRILAGPCRNDTVAIIENDFGEVGIDGKLLEAAGSQVTEIVSGCICCTLALDFQQAIENLAADPEIKRIIIEPSGVAKLTDVLKACIRVSPDIVSLGRVLTIVDIHSYAKYSAGFGAFFLDQVTHADTVVVSKIQEPGAGEDTARTVQSIRRYNPGAEIVTVPWNSTEFADFLSGFAENGTPDVFLIGGPDRYENPGSGNEHSADEFSTVSVEINGPVDSKELFRRFETLTADRKIIRIKGILESTDRGAVRVDWVNGSCSISPAGCKPDNRLVVIGTELPGQAELRTLFALPH